MTISHLQSERLFKEASHYLPGGVDSPVRAFRAVGGTPLFLVRGQGSRIYDADGNEFIDYVCSWGPLILGHAHPVVIAALKTAAERGTSFGAPTELETTLAKMVADAMPSMEMTRFVNSGTEATMSALRLARAYTGRDKIVKFAGCYHGHADGLLIKGGSGLVTLGIPDSPGVPRSYAENTIVVPYNNEKALEEVLNRHPKDIAAVIVEPVAANMGVVPPAQGFLSTIRRLTYEYGVLLIFDEVISGFRLAYGGAQELFGITPDLTCLGKIIGGGLPVGAYGGRRDIMQMIAPAGQVYQAGTLSGNPLAMTAGIETLKLLSQPGVYQQLETISAELQNLIVASTAESHLTIQVPRVGSILTVFFSRNPVVDYETATKADASLFSRFFHHLLMDGIYWPPSQFEAVFISLAHTSEDINYTGQAIKKALGKLGKAT